MLQLESRPLIAAPPGRYELDIDRCIVEFSVRHMVFSTVRGRIRPLAGQIIVDRLDPTGSWVRADLDTASIHTGNRDRDAVLRAEPLLDAEQFPVIRFESVAVDGAGPDPDRFRVAGDLYAGPAVAAAVLDVRVQSATEERFAIVATGAVDRTALGLRWPPAVERYGVLIGNRVSIVVAAEFVA